MRYVIVSKDKPLHEVEVELARHGAINIRKANNVNQLFCDVDLATAEKIKSISGIKAREVKEIGPAIFPPVEITPMVEYNPLEEYDQLTESFELLRSYYSPALSGAGLTVAVLDTGIRKNHESLRGKVVHEYDASGSGSTADVWGHGTGVAFIICGGSPGDKHIGVSPGAKVMNIKVLNDAGTGSEETIIDGINHVIDLVKNARFAGSSPLSDSYLNVINISIGGEDDGDTDNPIRIACRTAIEDWGIDVIASSGNSGPGRSTVMVPAAEPLVVAVGGTTTGTVEVWDKSSRGPSEQGETKPDFMAWATDLYLASHLGDDKFDVKSGTSFSAPIISGLTGLIWETIRAQLDPFTAQLYVWRWSEAKAYAPYFCVKPIQGAIAKDNIYGYGSPAGNVMIEQVESGGESTGMETFMNTMPMVMILAMMSGMI